MRWLNIFWKNNLMSCLHASFQYQIQYLLMKVNIENLYKDIHKHFKVLLQANTSSHLSHLMILKNLQMKNVNKFTLEEKTILTILKRLQRKNMKKFIVILYWEKRKYRQSERGHWRNIWRRYRKYLWWWSVLRRKTWSWIWYYTCRR